MTTRLTTHGPLAHDDGTITFRLWAPYAHEQVMLRVREGAQGQDPGRVHIHRMERIDPATLPGAHVDSWRDALPVALERQAGGTDGWWWARVPAQHGDGYAFALDEGPWLPDPASANQPEGVHEESLVWLHAYQDDFCQTPLTSGSVYELHVGTFTPEGTLWAAAERLEHLVGLVTHIELMPINSFDGDRNWGYDGVAWFATQKTYGGPDALMHFVQRAHDLGLAVILDVVYNHLGPVGNYLPKFGPYLSDSSSLWGAHLNLDGVQSNAVRQLIVDNIAFWVERFGIDGFRLDAVHALIDESSPTILQAISQTIDALQVQWRKPLCLIAESDRNDPKTIMSIDAGGAGMTAQWGDELHHAIKMLTTGQQDGYFQDFDDPFATLLRAWTKGFVFAERYSRSRQRTIGVPIPESVSLRRLIGCIQNHDQVGNRPQGDRLNAQIDEHAMRFAIAALCVAPHTPMLFMGEEFGATAPFPFFCNYGGPEMHQGVREGRAREFAQFEAFASQPMADPIDPATFASAHLDWSQAATPEGQTRRHLWEQALALRTLPAFSTGMQASMSTQRLGPRQGLMVRTPARTLQGAANHAVIINASPAPAQVTYPSWLPAMAEACVFSAQSAAFGGDEPVDSLSAMNIPTDLPPWSLYVWRL